MSHPAWILLFVALVLVAVGLLWLVVPSLGRLPGDVAIERDNVRIYIPITTCLLLSLLLTAIVWLWQWLSR
jgi:uncharacterized protein HemY